MGDLIAVLAAGRVRQTGAVTDVFRRPVDAKVAAAVGIETVDCGFPLVALITRRSREDLQLARGVALAAAIKATSAHLVPRR